MSEVAAIDIGGTHVRFAIAALTDGRVTGLRAESVIRTSSYASLQTAWSAYCAGLNQPAPRAAGIAVAGPIRGDTLKLTNNPWVIRVSALKSELGLDRVAVVNDFAAMAHAVAQLDAAHFAHLCGPDAPLPRSGVVSVVGPGTGLGVAQIHWVNGDYHVIATEGGHASFASLDAIEDAMLAHLRSRYVRVSSERIASGPGLANIYEALAAVEKRAVQIGDDKALWQAALDNADPLAAAALDRFCLSLGAVAGDIALIHGAAGVAIAGGIGLRLAHVLPRSGFAQRFVAKGRFEAMMGEMPVRIVTHPQPGLLGAAAAFVRSQPL